MSDGQERVLLELKTMKELAARLTSAGDKMEKQIKGIVKSDKKVKNRHRRKGD